MQIIKLKGHRIYFHTPPHEFFSFLIPRPLQNAVRLFFCSKIKDVIVAPIQRKPRRRPVLIKISQFPKASATQEKSSHKSLQHNSQQRTAQKIFAAASKARPLQLHHNLDANGLIRTNNQPIQPKIKVEIRPPYTEQIYAVNAHKLNHRKYVSLLLQLPRMT